MYLKAIEMQGFKSFPDKTVLQFGNGITGVVGPNGSGKSNIADAIRWVLGEQSTKSLRGSKMEDVIFSGTDERRQQGYAEVTLRLDNTDNALNHPDREVSVTRKYFRSGESTYQVNGQTVRLKDVHELFMDTGLGRDGYSMVSQGRIEEMVSAKSENRRDMLEEAAGISHFRYRRAEAVKRLTQSEENLIRLRDIVAELKSRVGPLEKQSQKAQQFLVYAEERKSLEIGLWLTDLDKITLQLRELRGKLTAVQSQYDFAVNVLSHLSQQIDSAAETTREINESQEALRAENLTLEEKASGDDSQASLSLAGVKHNNETHQRITHEIALQQDEEQTVLAEINGLNQTVKESEEQITVLNRELEELTAKLSELKNQDEAYSVEYSTLQATVLELEKSMAQARLLAETSKSSSLEIEARIAAINEAVAAKALQQTALQENKQLEELALTQAKQQLKALNEEYQGIAEQIRTASGKQADLQKEYEDINLKLVSKQSRLKFLEDTEKNMEGYQGSVKAVMKEKEKGGLNGIQGTLIQLITVEERYGLAIETALGNAVQDIVTDNEESAKTAIRFLQKTNAGRATFLPVSSIVGRIMEEQGCEQFTGFIAPAWKLVSCSDEYLEIIKSLLGRIIVCTDLDNAVLMARKQNYKYKIVTLDGQVINAGGSMTGGSKISHSGFLSRRNEITSLKTECEALSQSVKETEQKKQRAEEALQSLNELYKSTGTKIMAQNGLKTAKEGALTLTLQKIKETEKALSECQKELTDAQSRLEYFNQSIQIGLTEQAKTAKQQAEKEEALKKLSGGHETLLKQREQLNEQITALNLSLVSLMKEQQAKKENARNLQKRLDAITARISELTAEAQGLNAKNEELNRLAEEYKASAERLRAQARKNTEKIEQLTEERKSLENDTAGAREAERTKTAERENLSAELVRLEERQNTLKQLSEETEKKLFEEYGLTRREAAEQVELPESNTAAHKRLTELKGLIKALGSVNVAAIDEYKEVSERYTFLSGQVNDVEQAKKELLTMIDELTQKMAEQFREQFTAINTCFQETFVRLFGGGNASLSLENENDILECNIDIKAQPPGKKVTGLSLLSGGEKGLTAIALLFAILKIRPAPFCVFDEVEAALDDVNVLRYAQYVRMMTKNTQFILITHRRGTMEEADVLYGVTMQEKGVSKLLELKTAEMVAQLKLDE